MDVTAAQLLLLLAPLGERFLDILAILNVEVSGKLGKTLGKPLIVVTLPAHAVPPPLMRALVGPEEICQFGVRPDAQSVPLRGIEKCDPGKIEQAGPALPVAADDVGDSELLVGVRSIVVLKNLDGVGGFDADCLR